MAQIDPVSGRRAGLRGYVETTAMVAAVSAIAVAGSSVLPATAADLLYLVPVLAAASLYGWGPGITAAITGAAAYNFFFTPPFHTLRMSEPTDVITVVVLLSVALFTSRMAARLKDQATDAADRAEQSAALASFAQALLGMQGDAALGRGICVEAGRLFDANAALVMPRADTIEIVASYPPLTELGGFDIEAARRAIESMRPAGRNTEPPRSADWTFYPLALAPGLVMALGLARDDGLPPVSGDRQVLLETVLAQAALALERERLARELAGIERSRERERLRDALLSSVGHDLRTPLTAILAASAELRRSDAANSEIMATLDAEAHRLDRYVTNLLGMARIESGSIRVRSEPIDLTDAVAAAMRDLRAQLASREVRVAVPADLPLIRADAQLLHHCLINLIDNAARHGDGGVIEIVGRCTPTGVALSVLDTGPGLPAGHETRVLEAFSRIEGSDRTGGAGLGLAIVKGFADAMGVGVEAENRRHECGAAFTLCFPHAVLAEPEAEDAGE